jgi:hypothetical protein
MNPDIMMAIELELNFLRDTPRLVDMHLDRELDSLLLALDPYLVVIAMEYLGWE